MKTTTAKILQGLLILCALGTGHNASAQTAILINENGGASTSYNDGLKVIISTDGVVHVYRGNQTQYYPGNTYPTATGSGVKLSFRFQRGTTYNSSLATYTHCAITPAVQSGNNYTASLSGYVTSPISNEKFYVTMDFKYTHPNKYFTVDYYVRAPVDLVTPETVHLYLDHDAYILGCDGSVGYISTSNGHFVGDYRTSGHSYSGSTKNRKDPSHHGFKVNGSFASYYTGRYSTRNTINTSLELDGTYNTTCVDDGIAVHFLLKNTNGTNTLSAGQTAVRRVAHCYGDNSGEFNSLVISDPTPGAASGQVTVNFTSTTFSETEGSSTHTASNINISVQGGTLSQQQICKFTATNGTATSGTDYSYQVGFIIPAGNYATAKTLTLNNVSIIGNTNCQSNRTFNLSIDTDACNDMVKRGSTYTTTVTILDDDVPTMTQPSNMGPYCRGTTVPAVTFSGNTLSSGSYSWTNNNTSIGLAASGTGNLPSFTAANTGTNTATATITVTPTQGSCTGTAKTFTITVYAAPTAGAIGTAQSICYNGSPTGLTQTTAPTGGTGTYTYQWQSSTNNTTWSNITTNATSPSYDPGALTTNTYVRRNVTSGSCGTASSASVLITVYPQLTAGAIGTAQTIYYNGSPTGLTQTTAPTGGTGTYTYQWQSSTDNSTWSNITT
ncbi:MAG: hypothetical protein LBD89_00845, partial [Tannerellaceae bacterium]|nr:hypothetical protein [Tannerellaceae bacterium]